MSKEEKLYTDIQEKLYTPTTEEVRARFLFNRDRFCDEHTQSEWFCMDSHIQDWESWLAEHDRKKQAQAWEEGAKWAAVEAGATRDERNNWLVPSDNPYRQGDN